MCPVANSIVGFGSHECKWIPNKTLEAVVHHVFIFHLIGQENPGPGDEMYAPIRCQMKVLMKRTLMKARLDLFEN